jgi:hypothetical protein
VSARLAVGMVKGTLRAIQAAAEPERRGGAGPEREQGIDVGLRGLRGKGTRVCFGSCSSGHQRACILGADITCKRASGFGGPRVLDPDKCAKPSVRLSSLTLDFPRQSER